MKGVSINERLFVEGQVIEGGGNKEVSQAGPYMQVLRYRQGYGCSCSRLQYTKYPC